MDKNNYYVSCDSIMLGNKNSSCENNSELVQIEIGKKINFNGNKWWSEDDDSSSILLESNKNCFHHQQGNIKDYAQSSKKLNTTMKCSNFEHGNYNNDNMTMMVSGSGNSESVYLTSSKSLKNDQDNQWLQIRNSLWMGKKGSISRGDVVLKREWFKVGCFDSEKEMFREQLKGHVSRWKVRKVSTGSKIFYRCNKFKHFGCGYQMYAEICDRNQIRLYESGFHDHSSRKFKCLEAGARVVVDTKPSSSQQALLDQFIQNATKNAKPNGTVSGINVSTSAYARLASPQSQASTNIASGQQDNIFDAGDGANENSLLYVLNNGSNLSELLRVANDMDLAFTYNSRRTGEFCFESNAKGMRGRLVVFADLGSKVAVRERFNGSDLSYEEWSKADWKQFLWAVRGKCMNVLRGL